ncbi:ABC transporter permease subunit [Enterococcus sp. AZ163]|uniref:ABC transporter permease subunit n=1 Tax=Enterococcus sp. AZ163 TaxID=2774638 RepID=UPI003D2A54B9
MVNLIKAEFFRLGKGNAVRNVLLAGVVIIIITGLNMFNSGGATGGIGVQSAASTARSLPVNGADFIQQMRDDGLFPFFILAFATAVLGADYSTGTIRNTLSYFANRRIVFLAKCITGFLCCLVYTIVCLAASTALGVLLYGFGGINLVFILRMLVQIILSMPLYLGMIAIGYCLLVFTKKTSITITVYMVGMLFIPSFTYQIHQLFPKAEWLKLCDPLSAFSMLSQFWEFPASYVGMVLLVWLVLDVLILAASMRRYTFADVI